MKNILASAIEGKYQKQRVIASNRDLSYHVPTCISAGRHFYKIQRYTVITLHTQLNTAQLYMATTRHRTTLHVHNLTRHNLTRHNSTRPNPTRHKSTRPQLDTSQLDTPQLYTDYMAIRLKLLYSSERYEQSVNVITIRQKSRNTNDTFVRTVRYSTRCVRKVSDLRSYLGVGAILRHPDRGILRSSPHLIEPHAPSGASTS